MRRAVLNLTQPGWVILFSIGVLVVVGMASIYVTDTHYVRGHDGPDNAAKQGVRILVSLALAVAVLHIGYQRIAQHAYAIFLGALVLLIATRFGSALGG